MGLTSKLRAVKRNIRKRRLAKGSERWVRHYKKVDEEYQIKRFERVKDLPIDNNLIFFESFVGRSVADSPLAIFNEIKDDPAYGGYYFVWSVNDTVKNEYLKEIPRVRLVKRLSMGYYETIATAKYVINNITNNVYVHKKPGQIYIQTWHGTPLKRLGMDIELDGNAWRNREEIHEQYLTEGKTFDYLISPSPYTTEKLGSAFGLSAEDKEKKIVELGYPRNVDLFTCTDEKKAAIKAELGIKEGKKVILYCTTWREHVYKFGEGFPYQVELDLEKLYKRFGDSACVVMRMHYNHKKTPIEFEKYEGFLINGTEVDDINRLYVIADLLVTDYSSVMFDYANLRRPMVFYMYDRDRYENEVRGFYFDASDLPGPIVTDQEELEDAIEGLLSEEFVPDEKYRAFCDKFTCLDDADAAKRVVKKLLPEKRESDPLPEELEKYYKIKGIKDAILLKIRPIF